MILVDEKDLFISSAQFVVFMQHYCSLTEPACNTSPVAFFKGIALNCVMSIWFGL